MAGAALTIVAAALAALAVVLAAAARADGYRAHLASLRAELVMEGARHRVAREQLEARRAGGTAA